MNRSALTPRERARLKDATRLLVERAGGPSEAAQHTRVAASLLSRYGSTAAEHETTFAPADVVAELQLEAGEPIVTRVLADVQGFDLVPRVKAEGSADYHGHDTDLTRASCTLMMAFRDARADGKIDAAELMHLEALAEQLMREIAEFRHDAQRDIAAAGKPVLRSVR